MGSWTFCIQKYINDPLDGYYCDGHEYIPSDKAKESMCKQACFGSPTCGMMSCNHVYGTCLLASQPCAVARKHAEYRLTVFRQEDHIECTVRVRDQAGIIPDHVVTPDAFFHVARIAVGDDILVGIGCVLGGNGVLYIYILPLWDKWPTIPTKNSWLFILTAPWLGFPTRLATSFLGRLSWQECWQMVGVSTAFCLGTHLSACGFLGFMQNRKRQLIIHLAIEIGLRSLIFLCLCNRQGLLTCYLTSAISWMNINVVFEWLFNL